jgi:hypothetical protein
MAKAGVETSIEWIWLRDALAWVHEAFGSLELAKELLVKWLAAGDVPWSCGSWKGLDAAGVVKLELDLREPGPLVFLTPTKAYHEGASRWPGDRLGGQQRARAVRDRRRGRARDQGVARACAGTVARPSSEPTQRIDARAKTGIRLGRASRRMSSPNRR